jgi:NADH dehydrogenase FAD-containing subunit
MAGTGFVKALKAAEAEVTLVDPKEYFELPIASLRGLLDPGGFGKRTRMPIADLAGALHIQAKLNSLKKHSADLDNGQEIEFDYAVLATGSTIRGFDNLKVSESRSIEEREAEWRTEHEKIFRAASIAIVGGGPIGVELAGEILSRFPGKTVTLVHDTDRLLPALPKGAGAKAQRVLERSGARIILNSAGEVGADGSAVRLPSGEEVSADIVLQVTGIEIDVAYMRDNFAESLSSEGQVMINDFLQVSGADHIFALGDINNAPCIKLGAFATSQARRAAGNLVSLMTDRPMKPYRPITGPMGFVTLGRKAGIAQFPFGRLDVMIAMKQKDMLTSMYLK